MGGRQKSFYLPDRIECHAVQVFGSARKPQIQLFMLQHLKGMVGGLAGNGYLYMGMKLNKVRKIGQEHVFTEGGADSDTQMSHSKLPAQAKLMFTGF